MPRKQSSPITLVPVMRELDDDALGVIVAAAHRRAALVAELREALEAGDDALALRLARKVAGLEEVVGQQGGAARP